MSFEKLLFTTRGKLLLVNTAHMVEDNLLTNDDQKTVVRGLKRILDRLGPRPSAKELLKAIGDRVYVGSSFFHMLGQERPPLEIRIATLRSFGDLKPLLREFRKVHKGDRDIGNALGAKPSRTSMEGTARIINRYSGRSTGVLCDSVKNILWATTIEDVRQIETAVVGKHPDEMATTVRDRLGLVQFKPSKRAEAQHVFIFEAKLTLAEIRQTQDFIATRPTMLEGFDNARFRQRRPPHPPEPWGFGQTVDLTNGAFLDGCAEIVISKLLIRDFDCRYLGAISTPAAGSDKAFLGHLNVKTRYRRYIQTLESVL